MKQIESVMLLLKWAEKDRIYLILSVTASVISGLCTMIPYWVVYKIVDGVFTKALDKALVIETSLIISIGIFLRFSLFGMAGVWSHKGAYNSLFNLRCKVIDHMAELPLGSLDKRGSGQIKAILNDQIEKLELFLAHNLPEFIYYLIGPVAVFIYLLTVNPALALTSLVPLIIAVLVMGWMFSGISEKMVPAFKSLSELNSVMMEYINGMRVIKALGMNSGSFKKFSNAVENQFEVRNKITYSMAPPFAAYGIIVECGVLLMVPMGGYFFVKSGIGISTFILFAFVGSLYLTELKPLQELGSSFARVIKAVETANEILKIPAFDENGEFPENHDIEIKNISFSYDGIKKAVNDCSLKINQGETIAVVGPSGAGKTTLVQLISRFHDVDEGNILIGGKDISRINYEELLKNISIIFQNSVLTRDSVFENIKMGTHADFEEVRDAAKAAQIHDFIESLPMGYQTPVGEYGSRFSGGEKQRIAIARAILKNSPVLILDEATSAADPQNQLALNTAIANLCMGKTVLLVAHRLGIVQHCKKVVVVENNKITGSGTHEEMLETSDYYKKAFEDYTKARDFKYGKNQDSGAFTELSAARESI